MKVCAVVEVDDGYISIQEQVNVFLSVETECNYGPCDKVVVVGAAQLDFVEITAGVFWMGSPLTEAHRGSDEDLPSHTLTVLVIRRCVQCTGVVSVSVVCHDYTRSLCRISGTNSKNCPHI